jgi:hypothetical protein
MIFISHRGNINGINNIDENKPEYILNTINSGYDVEFDLWVINNKLMLGHDFGQYEISLDWLKSINTYSWIHCKNLDALSLLSEYNMFNYFFHNTDDYILTSKGYIWAYPNKLTNNKCISVMPEINNTNTNNVFGICSDNIYFYKKKYENSNTTIGIN